EGQEGAVGHRAEPFREWRQRVLGLGAEKSAGCLICAFRVKGLRPRAATKNGSALCPTAPSCPSGWV
ncbi:MAG: hypothetical protein FWF88_10705, partial [Peptococcaceae bacterium]|nr:hypothetical protein [Peptococcaceae bacterium]